MKLIIIFFTIFNINCEFTHKYTDVICHKNEFCKQKSNEFIDNGLSHTYQTPHCGLTSLNKFSNRIQGGHDSRLHKYPWYVSLFAIENGRENHFCGGTIINKRFIMTAAHCVRSEHRIHCFVAGTNNFYHDDTNRIILRPMIDIFSMYLIEVYIHKNPIYYIENDIALIKTSRPIEFVIKNDQFVVNSICLNDYNNDPGGKAPIAGLGDTSDTTRSGILQEAELQIIDLKKCVKIVREQSTLDWYKDINSHVICTIPSVVPGLNKNHSIGARGGDSGSALIQYKDGRAHAIGIACAITKSLKTPLNFHLRLSKYIPWIKANIDTAYNNLAKIKVL